MRMRSVGLRAGLRRAVLLGGVTAGTVLGISGGLAQSIQVSGGTLVNQGLQGVGRMPANLRDKFGETFGSVSAMQIDLRSWRRSADGSYAGVLYTLPDRGYNIAGTTNYTPRYNILDFTFTPYTGAAALAPGASQQNQIRLTLRDTVLFTDPAGTPMTGLDPSGTPSFRPAAGGLPNLPQASNGRISLDPEGFVRARDGSIWVSDEYGAYVYRFTADGRLVQAIRPPNAFIPIRGGTENYGSNNPGPGATAPVPADPVTGRQNNQGFEGLSLSADGKTLYVLLQSALRQDLNPASTATTRRYTRMLTYDVSVPGTANLTGEFVVPLPVFPNATGATRVAAQSDVLALNSTQFLVMSRDGQGYGLPDPVSRYRRIDFFDITGATNIAGTAFDGTTPVAPNGVLNGAVQAATYTTFIDMNDAVQLSRFSLQNGGNSRTATLSEKWEALSLAPALDRANPDDFFLLVGNDNDFITQNGFQVGAAYADPSGIDNDTTILAYRLTLPTYVDPLAVESQQATGALLGGALAARAVGTQRAATADQTGRLQAIRAGMGADRLSGSFALAAGGAWARLSRDGDGRRAGQSGNGWNAGVAGDYALNGTLRLGLGFGYAESRGHFGGLGRGDAKVWSLGPYLNWQPGQGYFADLSVRYVGLSLDDIRRNTGAYGLTANGSASGSGYNLIAEMGQVFTSGNLRFGPIISVDWNRTNLDGWTETDAIHLNLDHGSQRLNQGTGRLQGFLAGSVDLGGGTMAVPELRGGFQGSLSGKSNRIYSTVLSTRRTSTLATQNERVPGSDLTGWTLGTGASVALGNATLVLQADSLFARHATDWSVGTAVRIGF